MSMYQIISVKTVPVIAKDAPRREFVPPSMPFAERARLDDAAVRNRDRSGFQHLSDAATTRVRRMEWLSALPDDPFNRMTARACWAATEPAADNRIDALERCGLIKRLPVRPLQWVKA